MLTGKIYVGRHIGQLNDGYIGSGTKLSRTVKKYGEENFRLDVLCEAKKKLNLEI